VSGGIRPVVSLKLYVYGYVNRSPSSRGLEREAQRNAELMWLTGRFALNCGAARRQRVESSESD